MIFQVYVFGFEADFDEVGSMIRRVWDSNVTQRVMDRKGCFVLLPKTDAYAWGTIFSFRTMIFLVEPAY